MKRNLTVKQLRARLAKLTAQTAKDRDALRELIDDAESMVESIDEAVEDMERAADALSKYV